MTSFVSRAGSRFLSGFTLRESLVVGLCAVFIVLAALLLHIPGLLRATSPGRSVFTAAWARLLRHPLAATAIGLLAGLIALYPGMGRGQPPACAPIRQCGAVADLQYLFVPAMPASRPLASLAGALMGETWLPLAYLFDRLVGHGFRALPHSTHVCFGYRA
jgi:hypothetical protein